MPDLPEKELRPETGRLYRIATEMMTLKNERKRKEADMTNAYPRPTDLGLSHIFDDLRARWTRWRAFHDLVAELRTKSDDELRDAGLDPVSRRRMAERAIYGK